VSLSEGVSASIRYKSYPSGTISSNTQPTSLSDPGASGGQLLRRVSSTLNLVKDTYQSAEVRTDRQIVDFRHGVKRVTGMISGEWSPGTYWDFMEAVCRGTEQSAIPFSNADFGNVAASSVTSTFTFASGDPVVTGLRVGDIIQFTNLSESLNNSRNYLITGFSGSNLVVSVYPAPTTMGTDGSYTGTTMGKSVYAPTTGHVSRKFLVEAYHSDIDVSRVFTEVRVGGMNFGLPATGMATIEIPMMGRDMEVYSDSNAPFFASPTAETSTGIFAAVNGLIMLAGTAVGVVTGVTLNIDLAPSSDAVVGQNYVPEVFLGRVNATGQLTAMFQDATVINYFKNETEVSVLLFLTTTSAADSPAATILLPRVKFGDAAVGLTGEGAQLLTMPFTALKSTSTELSTGIVATTVRFTDSAAV
jgi:hypothetical protein